MKVKHLKLDFTSWSAYKRCPRRFQHAYVQGLKKEGASAVLAFGQVLHAGLEQFHTNGNTLKLTPEQLHQEKEVLMDPMVNPSPGLCTSLRALNAVKEEGTKLLSSEVGEDGLFVRYSLQHALELMYQYIQHWGSPWADFKTLEHNGEKLVEKRLEMPLTDKITYIGNIDLLAQDTDRNIPSVVEHKTAGSLYNFPDKARLSLQATGYLALARANGIPAEQVIFNGLKSAWGKNDKTLVNRPERNFQRVRVLKNQWHIEEFRLNIIRDGNRIIEDLESDQFTMTAPDACLSFNSLCPYSDVCLVPVCDRKILLNNLFTKQPWKGLEIHYDPI